MEQWIKDDIYPRLPHWLQYYGKKSWFAVHYMIVMLLFCGRGRHKVLRKKLNELLVGVPKEKRCFILQPSFFDLQGKMPWQGGAERYMLDLGELLAEEGYSTVLFQQSNVGVWYRQYKNLWIIGLPSRINQSLLNGLFALCVPLADKIIFSPFTLSTGKIKKKAIGISHGVHWDAENKRVSHKKELFPMLRRSLKHCDTVVSVDTNTVNFIRGTIPRAAHKCRYIPNYVDGELFKPQEKEEGNKQCRILFPRRLSLERGIELLLKIIPSILEKYPHVEFTLCGVVSDSVKPLLNDVLERFPHKVKHIIVEPDDMHGVYQSADIVLIPTIHSEGTSLSCLEAMATGKAIVSTNVGGLPELISDGFTGLLIEPEASALGRAIEKLVVDKKLRKRLGDNALAKSRAYSMERWRTAWREVLFSR